MNEHFLPITGETLVDSAADCYIIIGTISRDFGPWQKDQQKCLTFDFDRGYVTEYTEDGEIVHQVAMFLTPLPAGL